MNVKPLAQALWLVDHADTDEPTGKISLIGICDCLDILAPATEYTEGAFLFFSLRGIHGQENVALTYEDATDGQELLRIKLTVRADSPNESIVRAIPVNKIPVPHDGEYIWQLRWRDEIIAEAPIVAYIKPARPS